MPKRKIFEPSSTEVSSQIGVNNGLIVPLEKPGKDAPIVYFSYGRHFVQRKSFSFEPWYGVGIDDVTMAFQSQIIRFRDGQAPVRSPATVVTYCDAGSKSFLSFCASRSQSTKRNIRLENIDTWFIDDFVSYLYSSNEGKNTKKIRYQAAKSILKEIQKRGLFAKSIVFPVNPFPLSSNSSKSASPYTKEEQKVLAAALRDALRPMFSEQPPAFTGTMAGLCVLALAMRTGINSVPLLELTTSSMGEHFLPNRKALTVFKRRGNSSYLSPLRRRSDDEHTHGILPESATIIERAIELTATLRGDAPQVWKDRLWLYRNTCGHKRGQVVAAGWAALYTASNVLIEQIKQSGKWPGSNAVSVTTSRLRATFVNAVLEISGDPIIAARAAGHTVQVSGSYYLAPPSDAKSSWRLMGEVMTEALLAGDFTYHRTPVATCKDVERGEYAPKNGASCTSFLNCVRCRAFVVTGDDLYRLYSFYWLLVKERDVLGPSKWKQTYAHIIRIIDRDIIEVGVKTKKFSDEQCREARERARVEPHPFWALRGRLSTIQ